MNQAAKFTLLCCVLGLLAAAVVKLRGPHAAEAPTMSVPGGQDESPLLRRLNQQPMVLRPGPPLSETDSPSLASPRQLESGRSSDDSSRQDPNSLVPTAGQMIVDPGWFGRHIEPTEMETPLRANTDPSQSETDSSAPDDASSASSWPPSAENGVHTAGLVGKLPTPPSDHPGRVVTASEDSFWSISQRVYGTSNYYKALYQHNRARVARPDHLEAGIEIATPPVRELKAAYPQLCPHEGKVDAPRGA